MMQIPRSLIRQLRAVFCRLSPKSLSGRRPMVRFEGNKDGLRVGLHNLEIAAEYFHPGSCPTETLAVPLDALRAFEGRGNDTVALEAGEKGAVQARWYDGGVPQTADFEVDPSKLPAYPTLPEKMTAIEPHLLKALADASQAATEQGIRYATHCLLLRGKTGEIAATDGRQLLVQSGFRFPWTGELLIPASAVFSSLAPNLPVRIGKAAHHVTLQTGPWTLHFAINSEGRYPRYQEIVPALGSTNTHCRIALEDAAFLAKTLPRLPGNGDEASPVTLDCNGALIVRARGIGQKRAVEVVLDRSKVTGSPMRMSLNRHFLARALQLGLVEVHAVNANSPLLFKDEKRLYVTMPLDNKDAIVPDPDAIRLVSTAAAHSIPKRRQATMKETNGNANGTSANSDAASPRRRRQSKNVGIATLIKEAESLKELLRDGFSRSHLLLRNVRRQRQQSRIVTSTLRSLKHLSER